MLTPNEIKIAIDECQRYADIVADLPFANRFEKWAIRHPQTKRVAICPCAAILQSRGTHIIPRFKSGSSEGGIVGNKPGGHRNDLDDIVCHYEPGYKRTHSSYFYLCPLHLKQILEKYLRENHVKQK